MADTFSQVLDLFPDALKTIAGFGDDLSTAGFQVYSNYVKQ